MHLARHLHRIWLLLFLYLIFRNFKRMRPNGSGMEQIRVRSRSLRTARHLLRPARQAPEQPQARGRVLRPRNSPCGTREEVTPRFRKPAHVLRQLPPLAARKTSLAARKKAVLVPKGAFFVPSLYKGDPFDQRRGRRLKRQF